MNKSRAKTDKWFPDAIRALRYRRHFGQQDLADALGVAVSTVKNWERARTGPIYKHLRALDRLDRE